ncbi:transmembrane protein 150A-like [Pollicipes pollicipes]|nr:transmembrane protein 150A-like [Pollicipes pollicipes]
MSLISCRLYAVTPRGWLSALSLALGLACSAGQLTLAWCAEAGPRRNAHFVGAYVAFGCGLAFIGLRTLLTPAGLNRLRLFRVVLFGIGGLSVVACLVGDWLVPSGAWSARLELVATCDASAMETFRLSESGRMCTVFTVAEWIASLSSVVFYATFSAELGGWPRFGQRNLDKPAS